MKYAYYIAPMMCITQIYAAKVVQAELKVEIKNRQGEGVPNAYLQLSSILDSNHYEFQTDSLGQFTQKLGAGPYAIQVLAENYEGYQIAEYEVKTGSNPKLQIQMESIIPTSQKDVHELGLVVIQSNSYKSQKQNSSVYKMSKDQIYHSPGSAQDINRVLSSLPSVQGQSDQQWNSFVVRGGGLSENIFVVDGMEMANLSHWGNEYTNGGAISMLHLDYVKDLNFYSGNMPSSLPTRLSSATEIHLREGSFTNQFYQFDLNMAGVGVFAEGPIIKDKLSIIAHGRYSMMDLISKMMPFNGVPEYQNGGLRLAWKANANHQVNSNLMLGNENITLKDGELSQLRSRGKHLLGNVNWLWQTPNWKHQLWFNGYYSSSIASQKSSAIELFNFKVDEAKFQLKNEWSLYYGNKDVLKLGASAENKLQDEKYQQEPFYTIQQNQDIQYVHLLPKDYPLSAWKDTIEGVQRSVDAKQNKYAFFVQNEQYLGDWLLSPGIRVDYYDLLQQSAVNPRLALMSPQWASGVWNLQLSLAHQFPDEVRLMDWKYQISSDWSKLHLRRVWGSALGWKKSLSPAVELSTEAYVKYYDREYQYTLNTTKGEREILVVQDENYGQRYGYGAELFLRKNRKDQFFYEISYTYTQAKQQYQHLTWQETDLQMDHRGRLILGSRFHKDHSISGRLDLSQGVLYTPIDTARSLEENKTIYRMDKGWNTSRRDPIASLSLRYSHQSSLSWGRLESYVEASNLLNRTYVVEEKYELGDRIGAEKISGFNSRGIFVVGGFLVNF